MHRWIDRRVPAGLLAWLLVAACQSAGPTVTAPTVALLPAPEPLAGRRVLDQAAIQAGSRGLGCWPSGLVATADGYWFSARGPGRIYRVEHDAFIGSSSVDQDVLLEAVTRIDDRMYLVDADRQMVIGYRRGQPAEPVTRAGDMVGTDVRPESSPDGTPTAEARLDTPLAVAATPDGALLVTETAAGRIRRLDLGGTIRTVAEGLDTPTSLAVGADGAVAVVEAGTGRVLRWRPDTGLQELARDLPEPDSVAISDDGTVWVTGIGTGQLLAMSPDGQRRLYRIAGLQDPGPVAVSGQGLLVIDRADSTIWRIDPPSQGATAGRSQGAEATAAGTSS